MKYYKMENVKTHKCGPLCKGHTIYYGINRKSWLFVSLIRANAFEKTGIIPSKYFSEKEVSAFEVLTMLASGTCTVDDVMNIHLHKKVFITGKLFVD